MRKYIHVAKALKPSLTREAAEYIAEEYAKLRSQDNMQNDNIARVINLYFITISCQSGSMCTCMLNLNVWKLVNLRYLFIDPLVPRDIFQWHQWIWPQFHVIYLYIVNRCACEVLYGCISFIILFNSCRQHLWQPVPWRPWSVSPQPMQNVDSQSLSTWRMPKQPLNSSSLHTSKRYGH